MQKTVFAIAQMDCPSEENLIRMKLDGITNVVHLDFDIPNRKLAVFYTGEVAAIGTALDELNLGTSHLSTETTTEAVPSEADDQRKLLWIVLLINFVFFAVEMISGLLSGSMGLVSDSLDMLADAFVYGISLMAVGAAIGTQKKVARVAGYLQMLLAILGFAEVIRRFINQQVVPDYQTMISVSILALLANAFCLFLLQRSKSKEAHMRASMIFTSNDIIINLGVIVAGILVNWLHSSLPDLIIGMVVFLLVLRGAQRILQIAKD